MGINTSGLKPFSKDDPERARAMQKRSSAKQKENNFMKKHIQRALQSRTRSRTIIAAGEEHGSKATATLGERAIDGLIYAAIVEHNEKAFKVLMDYSGLYEEIKQALSEQEENSVNDLLTAILSRKVAGANAPQETTVEDENTI